jgi:acyl-CoA reductase-like NAD-dependent aldehyde dehydrogenase
MVVRVLTQTIDLRNHIGADWVMPTGVELLEDRNPANPSEIVARFPNSGSGEVDAAVSAAREGFRIWASKSPVERGAVLRRAADLLASRTEEVAVELTREQGKTIAEARGEIARAIATLRYFSERARDLAGHTMACEARDMLALTLREPIGVVALITPWNFPIDITIRKLAPALAYGNSAIVKPSQMTPLAVTRVVEIMLEAGVLPLALQLVHGDGKITGAALAGHPGINGVSFTGSTVVGRQVAEAAARNGVPAQCEMGGQNPVVLLADGDLNAAVTGVTVAAFGSTGQRCTAARRVIVEGAERANRFAEALAARAAALRVGPGIDPATEMGPLVSREARDSFLQAIDEARHEGAEVITGGGYPSGFAIDAAFAEPTVLRAQRGTAVATKEIFGPLCAVLTVDTLEEAIDVANEVEYGLSAAIYSRDIDRVLTFIRRVESGVVHVNKPTIGGEVHVPFGGIKASGLGPKEMGDAVEFFSRERTVYIQSPGWEIRA